MWWDVLFKLRHQFGLQLVEEGHHGHSRQGCLGWGLLELPAQGVAPLGLLRYRRHLRSLPGRVLCLLMTYLVSPSSRLGPDHDRLDFLCLTGSRVCAIPHTGRALWQGSRLCSRLPRCLVQVRSFQPLLRRMFPSGLVHRSSLVPGFWAESGASMYGGNSAGCLGGG